MCNGYWETCNCVECEKDKELYDDIEYYWDDKKGLKK